jgi:hypothetical protein
MHLVIDQVMQLQHVNVTDGRSLLLTLSGTTVVQIRLAVFRKPGFSHGFRTSSSASTIEHRADRSVTHLAAAQPR